ncbi:type VI secretion system membrane subunit TssM [Aquincola sp. MAHUQ-54]|uniref:Type VI secretion system membrane subunit TssM n=1 Tax=Aquincola agrisoli TaxID=3119538 RepID=A0AAW9QBX7_9BURK
MKKLIGIVLSYRFVVSLLALAALAAVWGAGARLGLGDREARLVASLVVFALWVLLLLVGELLRRAFADGWRQWAEQRQREASAAPDRTGREVQDEPLRARLLAALHTLNHSRLGRRWLPFIGPGARYRLPWLAVLGAGGAGKTRFVTGSDLSFPLLEFSPYEENRDRGYDGCEWHFASDAVILDTNGRFAESAEGRQEWRTLLGLLRRYRRAKPLDGVLIVVDAPGLAAAGTGQVDQLARQLRDRVHDLSDRTGFQVPVYVVFSQMDRIEGFDAFFQGADAAELAQPWGAMLSWRARRRTGAARAFAREFGLLASALREIAEQRLLQQQRSTAQRLGLYSFPIEFAKLGPVLEDFVGRLFQTNPYQFRPLFRGFYFASVGSGGELVSPAGSQIRQAFGVAEGLQRTAPAAGTVRRCFSAQFFGQLLLPDRHLALRLPWRLARWQRVALGLCAAGAVLAAAAWTASYLQQRGAQRQLLQAVQAMAAARGSEAPAAWIEALDGLREQAELAGARRGGGLLSWRFGLDARDALAQQARAAFFGQFGRVVLDPVGRRLEARLSGLDLPAARAGRHAPPPAPPAQRLGLSDDERLAGPDPVEEGYALYRLYNGLAHPPAADEAAVRAQLPALWGQALAGAQPLAPGASAALARCVAFYASQLKSADVSRHDARQAVLGQARDSLRSLVNEVDPVRRQYLAVRAQAAGFPLLSLDHMIGAAGAGVLQSDGRVSGLYTKQAWTSYFKPAFEEASRKPRVDDGLLAMDGAAARATAADPQARFEALKRHYLDDYASEWQRFLGTVRVLPFGSLEATIAGLGRLADVRSSPYVELVRTLDEQTSWDAPTKPIFEEIAVRAESLKDRLLGAEAEKRQVHKGEQIVGRGRLEGRFLALTGLGRPAERGGDVTVSMARYLEQLLAVRTRLAKLRTGHAQGSAAVQLVRATLDGTGSEINDAYVWTEQLLAGMDGQTQDAVRPLFLQPLQFAWEATLAPAAVEVNQAWRNAVAEPWISAFTGRYPFAEAQADASMAELTRFLREGDGLVWTFMRQHVDFLVARQGRQIVPRTWGGRGIALRPEFLETLNRLARVGEAIAVQGDTGFRFYLRPEPSPGIVQSSLELDGQQMRYQNGPEEWRLFTWPGPSTAPLAKVEISLQDSGVQVAQFQRGTWGLLRALSNARIERLDAGRTRITWALPDNQSVSYQMRADASFGPQDLSPLFGLQLPMQILDAAALPAPAPDTAMPAAVADAAPPLVAGAQGRPDGPDPRRAARGTVE